MNSQIAVMSKTDAALRWNEFDAVITIEDPSEPEGLRLPECSGVRQLILRFDDVVVVGNGRRTPGQHQVEQALEWARSWETARLLVHCEMGVSRSTAVALAILAERYGEGRETLAVEHLLGIRPVASCNPLIVEMSDGLLGRAGRLVAAMKMADERRFSGRFFIPS